LVPRLAKKIAEHWPEGRTFVAARAYLPGVAADEEGRQRRLERERNQRLQADQDQQEQWRRRAEREELRARWQLAWETLGEGQQEEVRKKVTRAWPHLARVPE